MLYHKRLPYRNALGRKDRLGGGIDGGGARRERPWFRAGGYNPGVAAGDTVVSLGGSAVGSKNAGESAKRADVAVGQDSKRAGATSSAASTSAALGSGPGSTPSPKAVSSQVVAAMTPAGGAGSAPSVLAAGKAGGEMKMEEKKEGEVKGEEKKGEVKGEEKKAEEKEQGDKVSADAKEDKKKDQNGAGTPQDATKDKDESKGKGTAGDMKEKEVKGQVARMDSLKAETKAETKE